MSASATLAVRLPRRVGHTPLDQFVLAPERRAPDARRLRAAILDRMVASGWPGWTEGYLLTEEETLPQALTGHNRREAFAAADRIAAGGS